MLILIVIRSALQFCVFNCDVDPVGCEYLEGVEEGWGSAGVEGYLKSERLYTRNGYFEKRTINALIFKGNAINSRWYITTLFPINLKMIEWQFMFG